MGETVARDKSVKQSTMETSRSRAVNKSEKHELELGHMKRKGMTGHAFKALFKKKRKVNTAAGEGMERPKRLPDVGSKRNGVSGTNKVEDVRSSKDCVAVEETFDDSRRMVNCSMPELRTREVGTSQLGSLNLAGPVSIGKSVEGDTDPSTHDKALISERKKYKDSDTDLSAMGKTNSICAPEGVSSPGYGRERRDSEEICVPFSKRVREDRDSVKEDHCSSDGVDTRALHNTLVSTSWNGPSLLEDRVGSKAYEKRDLNSSLEDEANLIDSVLDPLKAHPLISGIAEKKAASLKKLQKCCENRMSRIVEDQRKEIQEFHRSWEQKRVALAKKHKVDSARICSERRHPESTNMLEILDKEFAKKMEQYKLQKEMSLKELEEKQLASRNDESQKAAHWLTLAKSSANGENVHSELPLHGSENGNQVGYSRVSENEPPEPPEKVVPEVRVFTEEPSMDEVPSINETSPNGISSNVVSVHNSENEGKTMTMEQLRIIDDPIDLEDTACIGAGSIPCGVGVDIDTGELGTPVLEFDSRKTDGVHQIDSNAPNAVRKQDDRANNFISCKLSTIGEKCLVEASSLKENDTNNHLNCGQESDSSSNLPEKELIKEPQNTRAMGKISKLIKKIQKKCDKRMRRLVQKHEKEVQEFNRLWEQKWVILEKSHELDSAINSSMQKYSGRIEKLDTLNSEFAKKIEEYKHQKELFLKDLEQKQLAERNEECKKAAHWLTEAKSFAGEDRADGEPSWVGNSETSEHGAQNGPENIASLARDLVEEQTPDKFEDVIGTIASQPTSLSINTETVVANTTSENDVVMVSSEEAPVNRVELPNSSSGTDLFSVSANLLSGRPRDPEKQASDVTLSRAEAIAHDTLSDLDALAVIGIENSDKENNGGNLICSNVLNVQDDSINPEKVKVPPSEFSDIAQLELANHESSLVELPKPQPELSMNLHATPMNLPPACELVHAPEATLETGVINEVSPPDGLTKPIQHDMDNMEEGLKETVVSYSFNTEAEIIFPGTPRSPNEKVEEISLNILATRIEGANNVGSDDCDETLALTSPHACLKKLNSDGKRSIEPGEGVAAPNKEVGFESIEREIAGMEESSKKNLVGCSTVVSCSFNTEAVTICPWSARPPNEEVEEISSLNTLATRIEGSNSVGSSDHDETIALTSAPAYLKKLNGKQSIEQAGGVVTKLRKTAPTEEVGFESIEGGIAGMEESNEKTLIGCSNVVRKESDGANSTILSNSPSRGQSLEICSPHHPVVSAICDLPLPPNPETQNKVSQCIVSRDENGQGSQILSQQVEVLSPEVQSTVPPVVENQIQVAEDRPDLSDHVMKQIGGDLERDHPVLFSESSLGPNPDNSYSQDALVLSQVVELNADSLVHSNLQSEPNLSGQGSNNDDQVTSWMSALTLLTTNLQNELEKIAYEKEQVTKRQEDLNLRLEYECAKEKEERIAQIKSKNASNIESAKTDFLLKKKEIETMQNKLLVNEKVSETFRSTHLNPSFLPTISMQQVVNSSFTQLLHQLPPLQLVPRPSLMTVSSSAGLPSSSQQVSVTPPPLQVVHHSGGLFYSIPTRPLTITSITPVSGNTGARNDIRASAPHLRPFRPSASSSPPLMTPSQYPQTTLPVTPNTLLRASPPQPPPPSPSLWSQHSQSIYPRTSPPVPPHSSWPAQSVPRLSQPIPPLQTHYVGYQSQHAGGNMAGISPSPPLGSSWPPPLSYHSQPPFSTNFSGLQSPHYSSQPSYTNQSSLHDRQQPETVGGSTSTPGFTYLSAPRFLVDMDNL